MIKKLECTILIFTCVLQAHVHHQPALFWLESTHAMGSLRATRKYCTQSLRMERILTKTKSIKKRILLQDRSP